MPTVRTPPLLVGLAVLVAAASAAAGLRADVQDRTLDGMTVVQPEGAAALAARLDEPVVVQEPTGGRHVLTPTGRRIPIAEAGRPPSTVSGLDVGESGVFSCLEMQSRTRRDQRQLERLQAAGRGESYAAREVRGSVAHRRDKLRFLDEPCDLPG